MSSYLQLKQAWIDDYLDLYNYAKQLNDVEWQEEILVHLSNKDQYIQQGHQKQLQSVLWERFDAINTKMLDLFEQLRLKQPSETALSLKEQVWELKLQRIMIIRKLRAQYV